MSGAPRPQGRSPSFAAPPSAVELLILAGVAAAYFALVSPLGVETIDEGQIVYPSWAVSQGAIPYRDFSHLYGPSLFFLNGLAMRWLGAELMTIRLILVAVKAAAAVIVYLLSLRVASRPMALLAWTVFVVVWGTPLTFNIPYANHYASTLAAGGMLLYLSCRRFELGCALAGLCFGAAMTFKQTSGPFALLSFLLFLVLRPRFVVLDSRPSMADRLPVWLVRLAEIGVPVVSLAFFVAYLRARNEPWTFLILFAPPAVLAGAALASAVRSRTSPLPERRAAVWGMISAGACAAVFPSVVVAGYAAAGLLPDLVFNLARGLPEVPHWFVPYPFPDLRTVLALTALAGAYAVLDSLRRGARAPVTIALAVLAAAAGMLWIHAAAGSDLSGYARSRRWWGDPARLWLALPFVVVWWTGFILLARRRAMTEPARAGDAMRTHALLLLGCHATVSLLYLYPAGDVFHVVMALPSFLPLAAHLGDRFCGSGGPRLRRAAFGLTAATAALLAGPSLQWHLESRHRAGKGALLGASGVSGSEPHFGELIELAKRLDRRGTGRPAMLVTTGEQMLYFLAAGRSVMEKDEFVLYLIALDLVPAEDARRLIDETAVVERLAALRPLIVDHAHNRASERFRRTFERIAGYIDAHYRPSAEVGGYRLLEWAG